MSTAIYAGTFDPITLGHEDVILRGSRLADHLIVLVAGDPSHKARGMLSCERRVELARAAVAAMGLTSRVSVEPFDGLLAERARELGAELLVRGLRATTDFEYEQAMGHANANAALAAQDHQQLETVFLLCRPELSFVSSSLVRQALAAGRSADPWLSPAVAALLAA
jgi:pantetheine-phosphate adenylyltransferase